MKRKDEIERKFLVKEIPELSSFNCKNMSQGYLKEDPEIRVRRSNSQYFLTQKIGTDLKRTENETLISETAYNILSSLVLNNLIEKIRFLIPLSEGLTAELDLYGLELEGLVTVEVEFANEKDSEDFQPPYWFGVEVTYDKRFKNKNLAKMNREELVLLLNEYNYSKQLVKR